jgi:energy-coupling factor transporter ATP-binding protein EcfA2
LTGSQIEVRRFSYRYPQLGSQWALRNIEVQINAGEYVLLCGASGSGKSTLVRALTGLIPHGYDGVIEGSIVIDGVDTRSRPLAEWLMTVGVVFQSPQWQLFNSTVTRELAFGLESLGCQRQVMRQRIDAVAAQLGIEHLLERNPQQLSAGEQLLVALGTVLVVGARIIVLDEPFANLDGMHVAQVQAILRALHQQGVTIIVAEHRLGLVAADATRMIVLHEGQIVLDGRPADVLAHDIRRFHL